MVASYSGRQQVQQYHHKNIQKMRKEYDHRDNDYWLAQKTYSERWHYIPSVWLSATWQPPPYRDDTLYVPPGDAIKIMLLALMKW
jgi:hypothetical protein